MILTKRLRQIIDSKIPEYYYTRYPQYIKFLYGFIDFVDQECAQDIMNITDNLDPDKITDTFIDDYFEQYCKNLLDTTQYQLTNENKRLFLSISKLLYNNKGKKLSFDIALKYLTRFFVYSDENYVETIDYTVIENSDYWMSYDPPYYIPGNYLPYKNAYTYTIQGDFRRNLIVSMIDQLNPVGFYPEFLFPVDGTDSFYIADAIETYAIGEVYSPTEPFYVADAIETYEFDFLVAPNIIEIADLSEKVFYYNGARMFDGTRNYDGKDGGVFELYSIVASELGVPYDTFDKLL